MITSPSNLFASAGESRPAGVPKPGIYEGVPLDVYLAWDLLSRSALAEGRQSMAHLNAGRQGERAKKVTDEMLLGSALHTAILEPEIALDRTVKWTGERRAGEAWNEFRVAHAGKTILTAAMYDKLQGMVRSLRRHPGAREWFAQVERTELSAVGLVNGVMMKGRSDGLTPDAVIDLKKVACGAERSMRKAVIEYGYDLQSYVYRRVFGRERFVLITVEDTPPYDVVPYEFAPALLSLGEAEATKLLDQFKFCTERGHWPGRSDVTVPLEPPEWALTDEIDWGTSGTKTTPGDDTGPF